MFNLDKLVSRFDEAAFAFRNVRRGDRAFYAVMQNDHGVKKYCERRDLMGSLTPEQEKARDALKATAIESLITDLTSPENKGRLAYSTHGEFLIAMVLESQDSSFEYVVDRADLAANGELLLARLAAVQTEEESPDAARALAAENAQAVRMALRDPGFFKGALRMIID